jgi:hypothetical protein
MVCKRELKIENKLFIPGLEMTATSKSDSLRLPVFVLPASFLEVLVPVVGSALVLVPFCFFSDCRFSNSGMSNTLDLFAGLKS